MFSFKHFLRNYNKKFICLSLSPETSKNLQKWCITKGFNLTKSYSNETISPDKFNFHITIFYSDNKKYVQNGTFDVEPIHINVKNLELFGPDKNIPVLTIDKSNELMNIRKVFEATGLTDSWPEWKPHMSISYSWNGDPVLENVKLPDFDLIVDKIIVKNQKD